MLATHPKSAAQTQSGCGELAPLEVQEILHALAVAGVTVSIAGEAVRAHGVLKVGDLGSAQVRIDPPEQCPAIAGALGKVGIQVESKPGELHLLGRRLDHGLLLAFELPFRLPTFNPQLRTHWSKKGKKMRNLAWEVHAAVPMKGRPPAPLTGIEIQIERFSSQEPDEENLQASAKWLLDVLQPMHPKSRPYGMGLIQDDAKWCVRKMRVHHIQSKDARTRVRIYRAAELQES